MAWVQTLAWLLTHCVTMGRCLKTFCEAFSEPSLV